MSLSPRPTKKQRREAARTLARAEALARARARRTKKMLSVSAGLLVVIAGLYLSLIAPALSSTPTTSSTSTTAPAPTTTTSTIPPAKKLAYAKLNAQASSLAIKAGCPASTTTRVNALSWSKAPVMTISQAKAYYAHVVTTAGDFVIKLNAKATPITVNNFVFLATHNFYHCVIFHRAIPGFMIQTGDPTGTGTGGPGYTIADEFPLAKTPTYPLYSVAMANTGAPHSGGSQFFIVTGKQGETLLPKYSLFGNVINGFSTIKTINNEGNPSPVANGVPPLVTQRILSVTISSTP